MSPCRGVALSDQNSTNGGKPVTIGNGGGINPRRPLVAPIYRHDEPVGSGKLETLAPGRGKRLRSDATPTAMTSVSSGRNGGVSPPDLKAYRNCSTHPTWIYKPKVEEWWESDNGVGGAVDDGTWETANLVDD